jgi:hypothetical protein
MHTNTIGARKMLGHLYDLHAAAPAAVVDYPYASDSDSESGSGMSSPVSQASPVKKRVVKKKQAPPMKELPQPAPPPIKVRAPAAGAKVGAIPGGNVPKKEKKPRAKKLTSSEAIVPAVPAIPAMKVSEVAPPEEMAPVTKTVTKKVKRAPSAYNKFVSEKMKAGMSMTAVAAAWKEAKAKS